MGVAVIDLVFAGVVVLFVLRCAARGFVSSLMSLAAVVFGLLAAIFFFRVAGDLIRERFMPDAATIPNILAFAALFLAVFIVAKIVESMLRGIVEGLGMRGLDRFLGAILGLAEGVVAVCVLLILITIQPFFDPDDALRGSLFAELLMPFIAGPRWDIPGMIALARAGGGANV